VHENILAAVIRLDETEAFLAVEPLYGSSRANNARGPLVPPPAITMI
jgi:hypothetical protein